MEDEALRAYQRKHNRYQLLGALLLMFIYLMLYYLFDSVFDISGTFEKVCGDRNLMAILKYVYPRVVEHCSEIYHARQSPLGIILMKNLIVKRDLIIVLDFAILMAPFVTTIYYLFEWKRQKMLLKHVISRKAHKWLRRHFSDMTYYAIWTILLLLLDILFLYMIIYWLPVAADGRWSSGDILALTGGLGMGAVFHAMFFATAPVWILGTIAYAELLYGAMKCKNKPPIDC